MIGSHPGGISLTERLFALGEVMPPGKILDLGSGGGESVRHLRILGYEAEGIDLIYGLGKKRQTFDGIEKQGFSFGDMRNLPFPDGCFDICLAECSISTCGNGMASLREAFRVLRPGGSLLLSDVFFHKEDAPALSMPDALGLACWKRAWSETGFRLKKLVDETPLWREFYLESLWNDNADPACLEFFREAGKAGCGYFLAWLRKGGNYGTV